VLADPLTRAFISSVMVEAKAIGASIGCPIDESPEDRHVVTARLGSFKTSMLQDVEAGRSIELDALVTSVKEIGEKVGIATPNIDALLGLTRVFAQVKKLY
jgi:2-dehydropantoate 2-reductase